MKMSVTSISESERRLSASSIYSQPLKPWETRVLRLDPVHDQHDEVEIVGVHLEIAVITHLEGLGLVRTGEMVSYEALSYTWDSNLFSHAIRCNGLEFSVTANLHAALVHLRSSHVHRWLWIDTLCINQYDDGEKERQVRNMFHIYRNASTVLVWLGPVGPNTSLGAGIVNIYEGIWQKARDQPFVASICSTLGRESYRDSGESICVDEFLNDLQGSQSSKDGKRDADTLELLSMAWDGVVDLFGRTWLRRTWIIQEIAAASRVKFHCGPFVLSYDAFYETMLNVGTMIWNTRSVYLAGEEDMLHQQRVYMRQGSGDLISSDLLLDSLPEDGSASFKESSTLFYFLDQIRQLVHSPASHLASQCTQTELLLVFLVETVSRGFEVSIDADRIYSMIAIADSISHDLWGLSHNERKASSPQQLPVDYSVDLRTAVLRALKIRMNEIKYFYVAIKRLGRPHQRDTEEAMDQATKSALLPICTVNKSAPSDSCQVGTDESGAIFGYRPKPPSPSVPSWLILLAFNPNYLNRYDLQVVRRQDTGVIWKNEFWVEQDVTEPDTLVLRGKALGRVVIHSEKHPSMAWMALPCPLGQEFETCVQGARPRRALHQGCPDEPPYSWFRGATFVDTETAAERNDRTEPRRCLSRISTDSEPDSPKATDIIYWTWWFPTSARDGDIVVVFFGTCALLRPLPGERYQVVEDGLRRPAGCLHPLSDMLENEFMWRHIDDLESFVLI